jgi:hypothetical protein
MAGSGAGVNTVRAVLLDNLTTATPAVTVTGNFGPAAYGVIGQNDSGGLMVEAQAYSKWVIQIVPLSATALAGYAFSVYYTISPNLYLTFEGAVQGATPYPPLIPGILAGGPASKQQIRLPQPQYNWGYSDAAGFFPGIKSYEWILADAPSAQAGTIANPMTPANPMMYINYPVDGLRVVLTTVGSAGTCRVVAKTVP